MTLLLRVSTVNYCFENRVRLSTPIIEQEDYEYSNLTLQTLRTLDWSASLQ
jgi:hypothetical protein